MNQPRTREVTMPKYIWQLIDEQVGDLGFDSDNVLCIAVLGYFALKPEMQTDIVRALRRGHL